MGEQSFQQGPTPEELYKRGRESSMDLVKFVLTMATTILGVFFITLTGKERKDLNPEQLDMLQYAIWFMVGCVASGLLGWALHAGFYGAWAANREKSKNLWRIGRKSFFTLFIVFFILGIICSAKYITLVSSGPVITAKGK